MEVACILVWVLTGVGLALFPALVAGLGLVHVAVEGEDDARERPRVR